jgi:hypothetical protein
VTLLVAHQILVAAAIAMALLFGVRSAALFARGGGATELAIAIASFVAAAALGVYLRRVRAKWLAQR